MAGGDVVSVSISSVLSGLGEGVCRASAGTNKQKKPENPGKRLGRLIQRSRHE
jgi:hypothetical protein